MRGARALIKADGTFIPLSTITTGQFLKFDGQNIIGAAAGGGSTPTGTGWRHVTSGAEDPAASTPTAADTGAVAASGLTKITVGTGTPSTPSVGDLWIDTN
jgi:hypothetical protein